MNEDRTDNCEGLLSGGCPGSKQLRPFCHQNTVRKRWTKEENKTVINCYLNATKKSNLPYRMRWEFLELLINTMHAKFVAFLRTRDFKKLRLNSCKKRLRRMIELIQCQKCVMEGRVVLLGNNAVI